MPDARSDLNKQISELNRAMPDARKDLNKQLCTLNTMTIKDLQSFNMSVLAALSANRISTKEANLYTSLTRSLLRLKRSELELNAARSVSEKER
jgi:hypothetical protein